MHLFTFLKAIEWAGLKSLLGLFWAPGFMFGTPGVDPSCAGFTVTSS